MLKSLLICSLAFALGGCFQPMRTSEGHLHLPTPAPAPAASIPSPVQALPILPPPKPTAAPETYSVVVNNVRVQDLLFALARDAKLNVDINPGLSGNVTLNAIDQTLPQLLSRIAKQVDMRYEFDGPNLTVMPDTPYLHTYKIDYLNMERVTKGDVSVSGNILGTISSVSSGSGSNTNANAAGTSNVSSVSVQNTSTNKFWNTLEVNIKALLRETDKVFPTTTSIPTSVASNSGPSQGASSATPPAVQPVTYREAASVIVNPETGIVTVRATERQHEKIREFLDKVMASAKRQVLIEATIVEVQLNKNYQQGIDWNYVGRTSAGFSGGITAPTFTSPANSLGSVFGLNYNSNVLNASLKLLENFGNVRVLSSPRLSVVNNQTALLKVVDNIVYFNISSTTTSGTGGSPAVTNFTTTANTVPVGFIMNVTPQISGDGQVLLNIKPTISRVLRFVPDPNPMLTNPCGFGVPKCEIAPISNNYPEIQTREMESLLRIHTGDIAVMGGLIQDRASSNEDSIPGINRIPIIGDIFSNKDDASTKNELVIFLRPIIVKDAAIEGDYSGYKSFLPGDDFLSQQSPPKPAKFGRGANE